MVKTHQLQIGNLACTIIQDLEAHDSAAHVAERFPTIASSEITSALVAIGCDLNAVPMSFNALVIETDTHRVLIDTGTGDEGQLLQALAEMGVTAKSIDLIIITHAHGDHISGILDTAGNFVFPQARYVMAKAEWEHWMSPATREQNPQHPAHRNLPPIQERTTFIERDTEVLPGIWALLTPGHTPGHLALLLKSNGASLLYFVDAIHYPMQITCPEWSPRYDIAPEAAAIVRRQLLERAAREHLLVLAYHFPFPGLGRIVERDGMFEWQIH